SSNGLVWFGHLYHTGKFAFFVSSIFPMHTYLKISSTTCGEEPKIRFITKFCDLVTKKRKH
ncbi:hypothetical protein, partial [Geobacillus sp. DSP4a]|uniref:hypothetical protein n=1 Tax=Geobacillus sp. DSP4a TaxID=2508873 RepID=UPI001C0EA2D2